MDEKTVICEIVEAMEYDTFTTFQDWENKTQEIIALQAKWKTIGYAPQKWTWRYSNVSVPLVMNFQTQSRVLQVHQGKYGRQSGKEESIMWKAEALKESTDWKATADILSKLQKEWKQLVLYLKVFGCRMETIHCRMWLFLRAKEQGDFFTTLSWTGKHGSEKAIIEKLNTIDAQETPEEDAGNTIRELMKEWNSIGHVPFKEKDKLYKQYHGVIDKLFDKLNLSASQKN